MRAQSAYDSRINRIKEKLEQIRSILKIRLEDCPCCLQSTLKRVEAGRSPQCPVCYRSADAHQET